IAHDAHDHAVEDRRRAGDHVDVAEGDRVVGTRRDRGDHRSRPWPHAAPAGQSAAPPRARVARGTVLSGAVFECCPLRPGTASGTPGTRGLVWAVLAMLKERQSRGTVPPARDEIERELRLDPRLALDDEQSVRGGG